MFCERSEMLPRPVGVNLSRTRDPAGTWEAGTNDAQRRRLARRQTLSKGWERESVHYTVMIELVSDNLSVPYRNLRYLIVDDDPDQRYLVARTLGAMGLSNVVEATSGR